jgi:flagellar protein FlaI
VAKIKLKKLKLRAKTPHNKEKTKMREEKKETSKKSSNLEDDTKKIDKLIEEKVDKKNKTNVEKKEQNIEEEKIIEDLPPIVEENIDLIDEKSGFGWKGLGSRRIYYDKSKKEHRYEVFEPKLTKEEEDIKNKLIHLFRVHAEVDVFEMDNEEKKKYLFKSIQKIIEENRIEIDELSFDKILYYMFQEFIGFGKIDVMMSDEHIEDISCDGHGIPIFIYHRELENIKSSVIYNDIDELDSFVIKLAQICGKQISIFEPVVDGKLDDGSRLQTTLGKTITKYSTFTIRRFREDPMTPIDLIANNTLSVEMASYFWIAVEYGASILFCGGTASGKTTMLNALSLFLPSTYKIVSVEDTREINLPHENWIAGTTRTGFSQVEAHKTSKDIDMFDLIRVALRQRPRAIIVGEVRGREAYSLFQAMTTGHLSYSTVHASDMHSLIQRLESPPIELPRSLLTSLDMVVFLNNLTIKGNPVRRITNVTEIIKLDPETNRLVTVSPFYWISELNDAFADTGGSKLLNRIQLQNEWDDKKLEIEIKNRTKILNWMMKNNLRSYVDVGKIISDYSKDPKSVLQQVEASK